jgi:hypothetical protein
MLHELSIVFLAFTRPPFETFTPLIPALVWGPRQSFAIRAANLIRAATWSGSTTPGALQRRVRLSQWLVLGQRWALGTVQYAEREEKSTEPGASLDVPQGLDSFTGTGVRDVGKKQRNSVKIRLRPLSWSRGSSETARRASSRREDE